MRKMPMAELAQRHAAFLRREDLRPPLLGIWVGDYYFPSRFPLASRAWRPGEELRPESLSFERFLPDYQNLHALHERLPDDFVYIGSAYSGVPWMEAVMGCPVAIGQRSMAARPFLADYSELERLDGPWDGNPWRDKLLELTAELVEWAAGRFPVSPPLLRGPADTAMAIRGQEFITDFFDRPGQVKELLRMCTARRKRLVQELLGVIPPFHGGFAAGEYPCKLYAPGRTCAYNQEDAAAVLSPAIFRDVLWPFEAEIAAAADVSLIHLHSGCLYPLDPLLENPGYSVIEINYDHEGAGPRWEELLPVFRKVLEKKPLIIWGEMTIAEIRRLLSETGSRGLSLQPILPSEGAALAFAGAFDELA